MHDKKSANRCDLQNEPSNFVRLGANSPPPMVDVVELAAVVSGVEIPLRLSNRALHYFNSIAREEHNTTFSVLERKFMTSLDQNHTYFAPTSMCFNCDANSHGEKKGLNRSRFC